MTADYFHNEMRRLREVLKDAQERGDIYLEYDVKETMDELHTQYYNDDTEGEQA